MDVFDLFAKISLDTSEYEQAVKGASADGQQLAKSWSGFGQKISAAFSALGKAAVAGAGAATAAVGVLTKSSLDAYSSFEQLTGGVETLFKESADTVMEYADNAYKTAGMSANQYMETVTGFSATLLQGLAGDTEAAAEYADLAITDMADNANKMGTAMQSIQYAYQGFAKDNYTMLDNLKLGYGGTQAEMARLINDSGVLGDAIQVTADTVAQVPFDKIIEAIHVIQTQLGITGTTAAEAATTIEGSVNSMKAAWENLLTGIADENANLPELVEQFADSFETAMDNVMPRIVQIFGGIGDAVLEAAPIIAEQIPPMVESLLPSLLNAVASLVASVAEQLPSLLTILTDSITQFADHLTNNMDEVFDVGLEIIYNIVEGIRDALPDLLYSAAKLVTSFGVEVLDHSDEILQIGVNIVFAIIEGIANAVADFGEAALGLIARFLHIWDGNMDSFGQIGTNAVQSIVSAITGGQVDVQNAAKGVYDAAMRGFSGMGGGYSSGGGAGRGGGARRSLAAHDQSYWEQVGEHYESTGQVQSVTNAVDGLSRSFDALSVSGAKVAKQTEKQKSLFEQLQDSLSGVTDALDTQSDIVALEFDIWESSMGDTVTESEKLQKQLESLTAQQELQKQAVNAARDAYDQIVAKYGETSDEALSFQKTLLQETLAYQDLQGEIDETTAAINSNSSEIDRLKTIQSLSAQEFEVWLGKMEDSATEAELLAGQLAALTEQNEYQTQVVQLAQEAYQAMCEQYGENSEEALAYKETLLQEILTQQELQGEIDETTAALNNAKNAQMQFQAAAQNALTATNNFGGAINTLGSATSQFGDMIGNQTVSDIGSYISRIGNSITTTISMINAVVNLINTLQALGTALQTLSTASSVISGLGSILGIGGAAAGAGAAATGGAAAAGTAAAGAGAAAAGGGILAALGTALPVVGGIALAGLGIYGISKLISNSQKSQSDSSSKASSRSVTVVQNINTTSSNAASMMREARYQQERAVLMGV